MKTLLLIDANALIHRSYHALPPLTTREGDVVHAVYGFASVLLRVISDMDPTHIVAAFDRPEPTFRDELYEAYKAHRPDTPEDLVEQMPRVQELLTAFDIPVIEEAGFEADDIIGTVAEHLRGQKDVRVVIVTGDLDTLQLVGDNVSVYTLGRGMSDAVTYDTEAVQERYGIAPDQLADYKGLVGDPSDNIPGVPGIGKKTASTLLQTFPSLDEILAAIDADPDDERIPSRARKPLQEHADAAELSRELATIRRDAPVDVAMDAAEWGTYDRTAVEDLFRQFEFRTLLDRLPATEDASAKEKRSPSSTAKTLPSADAVGSFIADADVVAVEPSFDEASLQEPVPIVVSLTVQTDQDRAVVDVDAWDAVFTVLGETECDIVIHHGKPLWKAFIAIGAPLPNAVHDTFLAAHLLFPQESDYDKERLLRSNNVDSLVALAAAQRDAMTDDIRTLLDTVEVPLSMVLARMEQNGIRVDVERLEEAGTIARDRLQQLEERIYDAAGTTFTINSPQQLSAVLFEELELPTAGIKKTSTGMISTAEPELRKIEDAHPVVPLILEYRSFAKMVSTYIEPLPNAVAEKTGRIHTTFHQTVTATGRLSSSRPNLQNIPTRGSLAATIRSAFVPRAGWQFVSFDYSQVELRVAAEMAQDSAMLAAFAAGDDIHTRTAAEVLDVSPDAVTADQRRLAKVLNFGVLYGMSAHGFARAADTTHDEAQQFIDRYMEEFSGIASYIERTVEEARKQGFVETLLGRRRPIPEIQSSNYQVRESGRRMAINMPIQGTAADLLKIAMIRISQEVMNEAWHDTAALLLQVHDELLFEADPANIPKLVPRIRDIMEGVREDTLLEQRGVTFATALAVDVRVGASWGDLRTYNP